MKYMNHVKSGLLAMAFACAGICFTGCEDDVVINTGNSDKPGYCGWRVWLCKVCRWCT